MLASKFLLLFYVLVSCQRTFKSKYFRLFFAGCCGRHFMVCTYSLGKLPFAGNRQCKITLSLIEKTPICWESTMQSDTLSLWEICHLLRINNAKWHSLTLRDLPFAKNQQCKVTLSQFDQFAHCWKKCTSHSLISKIRKYERDKELTEESIMQTHSLSQIRERETDKTRRFLWD